MKKLIYVFAILLCFLFAGKLFAVDDSCLRMVIPNEPEHGYFNQDSTMIDTCVNSPTYSEVFTKKGYTIEFRVYVFNFKQRNFDTLFSWEAIDSIYLSTREGFRNIEQKYGTFHFKRCDFFHETNDSFYTLTSIIFDNYCRMDSLRANIESIDTVQYVIEYQPANRVGIDENKFLLASPLIFAIRENEIEIKFIGKDMNFSQDKLEIFDLFGKLIFSKILEEPTNYLKIDISQIQSGLYLLKYNNSIYKIIITR